MRTLEEIEAEMLSADEAGLIPDVAERLIREAEAAGFARGVEAAAVVVVGDCDLGEDCFCADTARRIRSLRAPSPATGPGPECATRFGDAVATRHREAAERAVYGTTYPKEEPEEPQCWECIDGGLSGRAEPCRSCLGIKGKPRFRRAPSPKEDAPHSRCRCAERVVIPHGAEVVWVGTISHSRLYGCYERPVPSPKEDAPWCEACGGSGKCRCGFPHVGNDHCDACGGTGRSTTGGGR